MSDKDIPEPTSPDDPVYAGGEQASEPERRPDGTFASGRSGNPSGRPKGARARALAAMDRRAEDAAGAIIEALVSRARSGDPQAAGMVLARVWPTRKGRPLELPGLAGAATTGAAFDALVQAMAEGTVTPDEAATVAGILTARMQALEVQALADRLAALEAASASGEGKAP